MRFQETLQRKRSVPNEPNMKIRLPAAARGKWPHEPTDAKQRDELASPHAVVPSRDQTVLKG